MGEVVYVRGCSEDREDEPETGEKRGFKRKAEEKQISIRNMDKFLEESSSSPPEVNMGEEKTWEERLYVDFNHQGMPRCRERKTKKPVKERKMKSLWKEMTKIQSLSQVWERSLQY